MLIYEYFKGFSCMLFPFVLQFYACGNRWVHFQIFTAFSSSVIVLLKIEQTFCEFKLLKPVTNILKGNILVELNLQSYIRMSRKNYF